MSRAKTRSGAPGSRSHLEVKGKKNRVFFCVQSITMDFETTWPRNVDHHETMCRMQDPHL